MANLTAREQLMLELINRARMDPAGEAKRYGISLNEGPPSTTISSAAKQVLAGNDQLAKAADKHTSWMFANDKLQHNEIPSTSGYYATSPFDRMTKAGYKGYSIAGENIAYGGTTGPLDATQSVLDLHRSLFVDLNVPGRGHRLNILDARYKELGVGHDTDPWVQDGTTFNVGAVTTDFGAHAAITYITGVVYNDTVTNDDFFSVGEQTKGRTVSGSGASDTTGGGGGYELAFTTAGSKTITFDLASADLKVKLSLGSTNVKVDAVNGNEIWTNASLTSASTAIKELHALGISKLNLSGSSASEKIFGNSAANKLDGNGGKDAISGGGGKDTIIGGSGKDALTGGSGADKFVFEAASDSKASSADTIKDFGDSGSDRIDLRALFSGEFTYRGEKAINGAHQVNVTKSGSDVIVHINLDADLTDEMRIVLANTSLSSMSKGDFIL
jgi:Ca2+-binding RTX toxin-like protein